MKLTLDHSQRLNLHALIGAQRASVDEMRLFWKVQDRIDLNDAERDKIGYREEQVNGMQQIVWDVYKQLPPQEFEFSSDEFKKISKTVKDWQPGYLIKADRRWLEPLLEQLDFSENGAR